MSSTKPRITLFAHLHKCAGTSVIENAIQSGLTLPKSHVSGHPRDDYGQPIAFDVLSPNELYDFIEIQLRDGVNFIAAEWSLPRLDLLRKDVEFDCFTIFRDPIERIISNMKMDEILNYSPRSWGVRSFLDESAPHRSANYYVKYFCGLHAQSPVYAEHVKYAFNLISNNFSYCFMDENIEQFLRNKQIVREEYMVSNVTSGMIEMQHYIGGQTFELSFDELSFVISANSWDLALCHALKAEQKKSGKRGRYLNAEQKSLNDCC